MIGRMRGSSDIMVIVWGDDVVRCGSVIPAARSVAGMAGVDA